jgi:hypothetical protein
MDSRETADKIAIADQLANYARAMDRIDRELGYAVWHPGGTARYGMMFEGTGRAFIDWVCTAHTQMIAHMHRVTNILIVVDGDSAVSEAYVHALLRFEQDGVLRQGTAFGRYLDHWSRREGRWAIDHREYVQDIDEIVDAGPPLVGAFGGRRDQDDPSYALFAGLRR